MKKLLLVDVPESVKDLKPVMVGFEDGAKWYRADSDRLTEVTLPSDEEIEQAWFTYDDDQKYESYYQEQGAKWLKSQILGE